MQDSFDREIDYLRISVTDRCNYRCTYCMPSCGVKLIPRTDILRFEQIYSIARTAIDMGFRKIRLTGGEPLVRRNISSLVKMLKDCQPECLAMTSNGSLVAAMARSLANAGLMSINISLDTLDALRFSIMTRGGRLEDVIAGIDAAIEAGIAVKLNTVVDPDSVYMDLDVDSVRAFAEDRGIQMQRIHRYNLMVLKVEQSDCERPPSCLECSRLRLSADGWLRPCLHSDIKIRVDFNNIEGSIQEAINAKPEAGKICSDLEIGQIGG